VDPLRGLEAADDGPEAWVRRVFTALETELRPGALVRDVLAEAHPLCRQLGFVEGIALLGRPRQSSFTHDGSDRFTHSNVGVIRLEWGGPTGYWLELRPWFSFGPPPEAGRRFHERDAVAVVGPANVDDNAHVRADGSRLMSYLGEEWVVL
jgi:hypothetical protein